MNIKEITVRLAMVIQEKDAEVFNMVIRDKKDKPSSITLNGVATLSFVEADENPEYMVKFLGEEVYTGHVITKAIDDTVKYAQKYVDNKAYYNKIKNSI